MRSSSWHKSDRFTQNLSDCSIADGAAHGFYSGVLSSCFSSLLTLTGGSPALFAIMIYGGNLATILGQWLGAAIARTTSPSLPRMLVATGALLQGILLIVLAGILFTGSFGGTGLGYSVCLVSILSVVIGNVASPLWHSIWAGSLRFSVRIAMISKRNYLMCGATLVALAITSFLLGVLSAVVAITVLLIVAGTLKIISGFSILNITNIIRDSEAKKERSITAQQNISEVPQRIFALIPQFVGVGLTAAILLPFLTTRYGFGARDISILLGLEMVGQILVSRLLVHNKFIERKEELLTVSAIMLAFMPLLWSVDVANLFFWGGIFLIGGAGAGARTIAQQALIHNLGSTHQVAKGQANLVIITTLASVFGGGVGMMALWFAPESFISVSRLLFLSDFGLRLSTVILLQYLLYVEHFGTGTSLTQLVALSHPTYRRQRSSLKKDTVFTEPSLVIINKRTSESR